MTATDFATDLALAAATAASDKLATDIVLIDVSDRLAITDIFVIATGNNDRQVSAIVDAVEEALRLKGSKPLRREGHRDGRWVLLDYSDIVIHVQQAEERVFYSLERLWKDCPVIPFTPEGPQNPSNNSNAPAVVPYSTDSTDSTGGTDSTDASHGTDGDVEFHAGADADGMIIADSEEI